MKRFVPLLLFIAFVAGAVKAYNYFFSGSVAKESSYDQALVSIKPTGKLSPTSVKSKPTQSLPSQMTIDENKKYTATVSTTAGEFSIELTANKTPITVNNFVTLAKKGFYNNTVFHRIIKGFMIQGGDPNGDGTGGPGYKFDDEPFEGDYLRGTVAMANSGPNTNGSQFFVMHADYPLPKNYVIFGKVTEGLDTIDKIATAPVKQNPYSGENSIPLTPITIKSVEIVEN